MERRFIHNNRSSSGLTIGAVTRCCSAAPQPISAGNRNSGRGQWVGSTNKTHFNPFEKLLRSRLHLNFYSTRLCPTCFNACALLPILSETFALLIIFSKLTFKAAHYSKILHVTLLCFVLLDPRVEAQA
ncbi:uncharacterized [Tachysurus ichikawai]